MKVIFPGVDFVTTLSRFKKRKKNLFSNVHALHKTLHKEVLHHSCAVDVKECTKKHDAHAEHCFAHKFNCFLMFLFSSLSQLLKLPHATHKVAMVTFSAHLWLPQFAQAKPVSGSEITLFTT